MNRILATAALTLGLLVSVGCENKINDTNFAKIKPGMDITAVNAILGPGEKQENSGMSISGAGVAGGAAQNSQDTYVWHSKNMDITVICAGGKVVQAYKK